MNQSLTTFAAAMLLALTVSVADAAVITVNVGNHPLQPNMANQKIPIMISGSDTNVTGLDLLALVADGGPTLAPTFAPGTVTAPPITAVDITGTGTIFAGNNNGQNSPLSLPQLVQYETSAATSVSDNGVLGFLTFDTTGFNSGTWPLALSFTVFAASDHSPIPGVTEIDLNGSAATNVQINNGSISIVPEPASASLAIFGAIGLLAWAKRCHRRPAK